MIPTKLTVDQLDNYFQTATYVERFMPSPLSIKNKRTEMFYIIDKLYGIGKDKDSYKNQDKPRLKIRLNGEQIQIYEFCILLLVKANEKDRDIITLRNFPYKKSFRLFPTKPELPIITNFFNFFNLPQKFSYLF